MLALYSRMLPCCSAQIVGKPIKSLYKVLGSPAHGDIWLQVQQNQPKSPPNPAGQLLKLYSKFDGCIWGGDPKHRSLLAQSPSPYSKAEKLTRRVSNHTNLTFH